MRGRDSKARRRISLVSLRSSTLDGMRFHSIKSRTTVSCSKFMLTSSIETGAAEAVPPQAHASLVDRDLYQPSQDSRLRTERPQCRQAVEEGLLHHIFRIDFTSQDGERRCIDHALVRPDQLIVGLGLALENSPYERNFAFKQFMIAHPGSVP